MIRIGHGYDVHRLTEGRRLVLGGVVYGVLPLQLWARTKRGIERTVPFYNQRIRRITSDKKEAV